MVQRNLKIRKSVAEYLRTRLPNWGMTSDDVEIDESFDYKRWAIQSAATPSAVQLSKNVVSFGFSFDDGGRQAEMGSTLIERVISFEVFIFALSEDWADNIGGAIQNQIWADQVIPLWDFGSSDDPEIIDHLEVPDRGSVRFERVPISDPRPWEEHLFRVIAKATDCCYAETP